MSEPDFHKMRELSEEIARLAASKYPPVDDEGITAILTVLGGALALAIHASFRDKETANQIIDEAVVPGLKAFPRESLDDLITFKPGADLN